MASPRSSKGTDRCGTTAKMASKTLELNLVQLSVEICFVSQRTNF